MNPGAPGVRSGPVELRQKLKLEAGCHRDVASAHQLDARRGWLVGQVEEQALNLKNRTDATSSKGSVTAEARKWPPRGGPSPATAPKLIRSSNSSSSNTRRSAAHHGHLEARCANPDRAERPTISAGRFVAPEDLVCTGLDLLCRGGRMQDATGIDITN